MALLLNHFNFKRDGDAVLITNDAGHFMFLDEPDFQLLVRDPGAIRPELAQQLASRLFLSTQHRELFANEAGLKVRNQKSYLLCGTQLHIFVLTNRCNQRCIYCQTRAGSPGSVLADMTFEVAERAVDIALQSPSPNLSFEFQGGEPTLNFATLRHIVEYTERRRNDREITYSVVTNLAHIDDEMLAFIADRRIAVSTSLDGPSDLHTQNRPWIHDGTFDSLVRNIERARKAGCAPLGAILTTTSYSLGRARDIVDTHVNLGFNSVFVRPLTPLGRARLNWHRIGYTPQQFVEFYAQCLAHIVELALRGVDISEVNAATLLKRIFNQQTNYMELRSPCGAAIGQLAYNYDGAIYPCDEGRMLAEAGDYSFKLGDVFHSDLIDLIESPTTKAMCIASCLESLPGCSQCVYMPYCGTCPVVSYAQGGTLFPQRGLGDHLCVIHKGMLDSLFAYLRADDESVRSLLEAWAL